MIQPDLTLHIPSYEELWYRQQLMADPETMSYNRGYDLDIPGYNAATGCIPFPEENWRDWYDYFTGQGSRQFYAYLQVGGEFVGEVNLHRNGGDPWYEMGIVVEARRRRRGYGRRGLELLLRHAFRKLDAQAVHNEFEEDRPSALALHLAVGFQVIGLEDGVVAVGITREEFQARCGA